MKILATVSAQDLCHTCRNCSPCRSSIGQLFECATAFQHAQVASDGQHVESCSYYRRRPPKFEDTRRPASPLQIAAARKAITDDDVQVDDDAAVAPIEGSTAYWIQAWIYMDGKE